MSYERIEYLANLVNSAHWVKWHSGMSLTATQMRILKFVARHPHSSITKMRNYLRLSAPTICESVGLLVEKKLVEKSSTDADLRVRRLALTEKARLLIDSYANCIEEEFKARPLSADLDDALVALISKVELAFK